MKCNSHYTLCHFFDVIHLLVTCGITVPMKEMFIIIVCVTDVELEANTQHTINYNIIQERIHHITIAIFMN